MKTSTRTHEGRVDDMSDYSFASIDAEFMPEELFVLLVYDQDEPLCGAERILRSCRIRFQRARNCFETREVLRGPAAPGVVVTDLTLPDGDWTDILRAANTARAKTPVIVASRVPDIKLYLDVLDSGAHDFVVPPFSSSDLAYIIRTAIQTDRSFPSQSLGRDGSPEGQGNFRITKPSSMEIFDPLQPQNEEKIP